MSGLNAPIGIGLEQIALALGADPTRLYLLTAPGNPIPKARPRVTRKGHAYTPARTEAAEQQLAWTLKRVKPTRLEGPIVMAAAFYRENLIRCDLDNLMKLVLDAGTKAGLWIDDSQVVASCAVLESDAENPRTELVWAPRRAS